MTLSGKVVGGIPIEKWKMAFAYAVDTAIDKDYFSDTLFFELYPAEDDEDRDYEKLWGYVDEAFKEFFGYDRYDCYNYLAECDYDVEEISEAEYLRECGK